MVSSCIRISPERETAKAVYFAEWVTVGAHFTLEISDKGDWLAKPDNATHLMLQTITANIRYTIDESEATLTHD